MKIVLDTNVVVSGILFGGMPSKVLEIVMEDDYQVILSEEIMHEYIKTLDRIYKKIKNKSESAKEILDTLISEAIAIDNTDIETPECRDPYDIMFLQAAIAGKDKFLISGDKDLLDVGIYQGGRVIKPKEFCDLHH